MSKKLIVSLLFRGGNAAGSEGTKAWAVGKDSMGAVNVGGGGGVLVELGVKDGKMICGAGFGSFTKRAVGVVLATEGWNGVGVAVESGAEVIRMIGRTT